MHANGFALDARSYTRSFEILKDSTANVEGALTEVAFVPYSLASQAIELALKVVLLLAGDDEGRLKKKFGHKLTDLYAEAKTRGLDSSFGDEERLADCVALLDKPHRERSFAYATVQYLRLPDLDALHAVIRPLVDEASRRARTDLRSREFRTQ